jgi:hypothetical protein
VISVCKRVPCGMIPTLATWKQMELWSSSRLQLMGLELGSRRVGGWNLTPSALVLCAVAARHSAENANQYACSSEFPGYSRSVLSQLLLWPVKRPIVRRNLETAAPLPSRRASQSWGSWGPEPGQPRTIEASLNSPLTRRLPKDYTNMVT